jgi:hypothetical protein
LNDRRRVRSRAGLAIPTRVSGATNGQDEHGDQVCVRAAALFARAGVSKSSSPLQSGLFIRFARAGKSFKNHAAMVRALHRELGTGITALVNHGRAAVAPCIPLPLKMDENVKLRRVLLNKNSIWY